MNRFFASFIFLCSALFGYELQIFGGSNFFKFSKVTGKYAFSNHVNTGFVYRTALADYENARAKISFTSDNAVFASIGDAYSALSQQEISFQKSLGAIDAAITVGLGAHYVAKNESDEENKWQHNLNSIFSCGIDLSYQQFSLDVFAYVPIYNLISLHKEFVYNILYIQNKKSIDSKNTVLLSGNQNFYEYESIVAARLYYEFNDNFRLGIQGKSRFSDLLAPIAGIDLLFKHERYSINVKVDTNLSFEFFTFEVLAGISFDAAKTKHIKPSKSGFLIDAMIYTVEESTISESQKAQKIIAEYDKTNVFIITDQANECLEKIKVYAVEGENFVYESDFSLEEDDEFDYTGSDEPKNLHSIKAISIDKSSEEKIVITDVFEKMSKLISQEGAYLSKEENIRNLELCLKYIQVFNFFDSKKAYNTDRLIISADSISNAAENPILRTLTYYLSFVEDKSIPFFNNARYTEAVKDLEIKLRSDFEFPKDKQDEFINQAVDFFTFTEE